MRTATKTWMICGIIVCLGSVAGAQRSFRWADVYAAEAPADGVRVNGEDGTLVVTGTPGTPRTIRLLTIDNPGMEAMQYQLAGAISYRDVEGEAYLEMWNIFPDGSRYFSRTLSDAGPMGKLVGTHAGRAFLLPFNRSGASGPPTRLEVNLVLPGAGVLTLEEITLRDARGRMGYSIPGAAWLMIAILSGLGICLGLMLKLRRGAHDTTEARKMRAMDI